MALERILNFIADLVFPKFCVGCGEEGIWLCENCFSLSPSALTCYSVKGQNDHLDGLLTFFDYKEGSLLGKLIKHFKYSSVLDIQEVWKKIIKSNVLPLRFYSDFGLLPVPLHPRRKRERGFNQAAIITHMVESVMRGNDPLPPQPDAPAYNNSYSKLERVRYTKQQAQLNRKERQTNLVNAFVWKDSKAPARVLLIDDVYTTGATMNECARILKEKGCQCVLGLALAKGK